MNEGVSRRQRKSAAGNLRKRVRQKVRTLMAQVGRCGDETVVARTKDLNAQLSKKSNGTADQAAGRRIREIEAIERRPGQKYDIATQRDLVLIALSETVSIELRILAGAMLVVDRANESVGTIHSAFPGLMPAIVAATRDVG